MGKRFFGWKVLLLGLMLLIAPLIVFYGCAKKQIVKQEAPQETLSPGTGSQEGSAETKISKEELPKEERLEEESLKGDALVAKLQGQLLDINFEFDQFILADNAREKLKNNASILSKYPDINILIEGHCDERGTEEYNLALGERRAESARQYLVTLGINASRISTVTYGEEKPLDPEHNEIAWGKNRRDQFVIVSK